MNHFFKNKMELSVCKCFNLGNFHAMVILFRSRMSLVLLLGSSFYFYTYNVGACVCPSTIIQSWTKKKFTFLCEDKYGSN